MLQTTCLEDHIKNIGIDQSSRNRPCIAHKCLNNKKKYEHAGKCDDQQILRDIIHASMVPTQEQFTNFSPILCINQTTVQ